MVHCDALRLYLPYLMKFYGTFRLATAPFGRNLWRGLRDGVFLCPDFLSIGWVCVGVCGYMCFIRLRQCGAGRRRRYVSGVGCWPLNSECFWRFMAGCGWTGMYGGCVTVGSGLCKRVGCHTKVPNFPVWEIFIVTNAWRNRRMN